MSNFVSPKTLLGFRVRV